MKKPLFFQTLLAAALLIPLLASGAPQQRVRGLIVKLDDVPAAGSGARESPQAERERLMSASRGAGIAADGSAPVASGAQLLKLAAPLAGAQLDAAVQRLRASPGVVAVEPDVREKLRATMPNDTLYPSQWYLQPLSPSNPAAIDAPAAWDVTIGSPGVTVAVVDTGVRFSHPDLAGRLLPGYDLVSEVEFANDGDGRDADSGDPGDWVASADVNRNPALFDGCTVEDSSWHGTFIAGEIGAATDNGAGVAGVDWRARIVPVRVSGKCGALLSDLLDGLRWAAGLQVAGLPLNPNPARIINLSLGGGAPCSAIYQDVIDEITAKGVLLVVAAGNESGPLRRPADCRNVVAVGAASGSGTKASYSNFGAGLSLLAPGGTSALRMLSTSNAGTTTPAADNYAAKIGTSFAAPLATGTAALMLALDPSQSPALLSQRLRATARPHAFDGAVAACGPEVTSSCNCTVATCGPGLLDTRGAVRAAQGLPVEPVVPPAGNGGGGGGSTSVAWGAGLWALALLALAQRRRLSARL